jgi:hypothetical protein
MAYSRNLQPEEIISGDLGEKAVGSWVAVKCFPFEAAFAPDAKQLSPSDDSSDL